MNYRIIEYFLLFFFFLVSKYASLERSKWSLLTSESVPSKYSRGRHAEERERIIKMISIVRPRTFLLNTWTASSVLATAVTALGTYPLFSSATSHKQAVLWSLGNNSFSLAHNGGKMRDPAVESYGKAARITETGPALSSRFWMNEQSAKTNKLISLLCSSSYLVVKESYANLSNRTFIRVKWTFLAKNRAEWELWKLWNKIRRASRMYADRTAVQKKLSSSHDKLSSSSFQEE